MDFDAFIELVKEQQGIDLSEVLTTADQIKRPEKALEDQAIIDFNTRNPMAGGGMLVQPGFGGTRQGYAGKEGKSGTTSKRPPSETSQKFINYVKSLDKKVLATKTIDQLIEDSGIDIKKDTASGQLNRNNPDLKYKKVEAGTKSLETQKKITEISDAKKIKRIETIQKVNNWTNNWFQNNAGKYNSYEKAKTKLIKDWKKESKNKIYSGSNFKLSLENGMPNIMAATAEGSQATRVADNIFDITFPIQRSNKELIFQKGYANYRLQNPTFNKKLNDYFDLVILDKRGFDTQQELIRSGQLKEGFGLVRTETGDFTRAGSKSIKGKGLLEALNIDKEVLNFVTTYMKQDGPFFTKTGGENIYDIISKNVDPEKVKNYRNKININPDNWRDNLDAVVKLANEGLPPTKQITSTQLVTQMKNESKKMAKLFNLKDLPDELKFFGYSQDHLLGIKEALISGDPRIARQTLNTMVGTTRAQNTFLGFKEFGNERRKLITEFNTVPPKARGPIVQKLNNLTKKFIPNQLEYGVRKDGSMKVKVLQPQKTLKSRRESYISEVRKLPINVRKQFATLGGGNCGRGFKNQGGRIGLQDGTPDVNVCFRKAIERVRKGGVDFTKAESVNFSNLTKSLRAVGASNIMKFGIIPEALFEGALIADKMASEGDSFAQGLRSSYLAIPFQAMGIAKTYEEGKRDEVLAAAPESQKGQVQDVFNMQDSLNKKNQLRQEMFNLEKQKQQTDAISDGSFGYVGDTQDLDNRILKRRQELEGLYDDPRSKLGKVSRDEKLLTGSPLDLNIKDQLTMDAYNQAVEKSDTDRASNILFEPGAGLGIDAQIKKRMKDLPINIDTAKEYLQETGDYFGTGYTPQSLNKLFTLMGREDPQFGIDKETGKYDQDRGLQDYVNYLRTLNFADNFRDEKAGGGRAGFKFGTRKGVLSLIDKSVKSTPKDTTTQLDKLIKETLDKDFFDKKDRIVDTLNAKAARERKKYSYNQKVQEEPSQLNFYDDIVQSNFRGKTGPFFDYQKRKNKAGGGILKQAGDSSGPPPESGPNPQGLQGLIKRGMKI
jgi:hypothetical protein